MDAASAPLFIESGSPASRANSRLVPSGWQPLNCKQRSWTRRGTNVLLGWRGHQGACAVGIVLELDGCLARFGSQPVQRRNGASRAMQRGSIDTIVARTTRDSFAVLTPRRLMGVNPQVPGSSPGRGANYSIPCVDSGVSFSGTVDENVASFAVAARSCSGAKCT